MLPIGFVGFSIQEFVKKRTRNEKHLLRNFLLANVLFSLAFGLIVGGGMALYGSIMNEWRDPSAMWRFMGLAVTLLPALGLIHGIVWWMIFRRKNK